MNTHTNTIPARRRWPVGSLMLLVVLVCALGLAACTEDESSGPVDNPNTNWVETTFSLMPATSCAMVHQRIVDTTVEAILQYRYEPQMRFAAEDTNGGTTPTASPTDYTTTNVQEVGVDEVDIVKTDGDYIYTVVGGDFVIVDSWPVADVSEIARIDLDGANQDYYRWSPGLFLYEDRVVVFQNVYDYGDPNGDNTFYGTRFVVIDVTDRANPVVERQLDVEGYFSDARMIGGEVYTVTNASPSLPINVWEYGYQSIPGVPEPYYGDDEVLRATYKSQARPVLRNLITAALASTPVTEMLPRQRAIDGQGAVVSEAPLMGCTDIYMPQTLAELGILNVSHLSLEQPGANASIDTVGLLANGWQVYASQQNLYVALSSRWWWWGWGGGGGVESHIHKFGLQGPNGHPAYVASGKVDGWLLNQFSMSEYNGYLRVATTDNTWEWDPTGNTSTVTGGNHLTVFGQNGGLLEAVGALRDLAPGEQIYACRMMGDKGFVVTFRQTDPLFTIDLSDPIAPTLLGELHINGFSSYIHPLGDDHLLTIGQDADADGRVQGVQLQIFDVSDMTNPTRVHQQLISTGSWSSWSEAMWDHHAFTYHPVRGVLGIPVNVYEWDVVGGENFSGLMLYKVDAANGFTELGKVNHADLVSQQWCVANSRPYDCLPEYQQWWTTVRRSIFIEDYVYSLSDIGLKVNDLLDPAVEHAAMVLLR